MRMMLASVAVTMLIAIAPVSAQTSSTTMTCKDQITKGDPMMMAMADGSKKTSAMKEMTMAKEMMAKNDEKACMMHMDAFRTYTGVN